MDWTQTITIIGSIAAIVGGYTFLLYRAISDLRSDAHEKHRLLNQDITQLRKDVNEDISQLRLDVTREITEMRKDIRLINDKLMPPHHSE